MELNQEFLKNFMKPRPKGQPKQKGYKGYANIEEYYAKTTARQRIFSAAELERLDRKARHFIMRPMVNSPKGRFRKMGWVSPEPLSDHDKKISTTGYIEDKFTKKTAFVDIV